MMRFRNLAVLLVCVSPLLGEGQTPSGQGANAKIWVGRYQEIEDYLRTAECVSTEALGPSGITRCNLRPGGPVARMAWRPLLPGTYRGFKESYKTNIVAYELDKLLKLDMVPPAVERKLEGNSGAAQLWVEKISDMRGNPTPGESYRRHWENQLARMTMFDDLIGNRDRNAGNMLHDEAWNLILIDHSRAFGTDTELQHKMTRIDEAFWTRIEGLTRSQLDAALGKWLEEDAIRALLDRRERMKSEIRLLPR